MMEWLTSTFGSGMWADMGKEVSSLAGEAGDWLSADSSGGFMSSNLMSGVSSALKGVGMMSAKGSMGHAQSQSHSTAFHAQVGNANPMNVASQTFNMMKTPDNSVKTLSGLRNMF